MISSSSGSSSSSSELDYSFGSKLELQERFTKKAVFSAICSYYGLRTYNEGMNQRNLKIWADVADDICMYASAVPKNLEVGVDSWPCSEGNFPQYILGQYTLSFSYVVVH